MDSQEMATIAEGEQRKMTIGKITEELKTYGDAHKLRGLEGRIQRGLDPAGMLAVKETAKKLESIAEAVGASMIDVTQLTNELHVGAIWKNADALAEASRPDIKTWIIAGDVTTNGKETEGDLSEEDFIKDVSRVQKLLDAAQKDPDGFFKQAKERLIEQSKSQFHLEDDVPVSDLDSAFLAMAVNGYHSGIVKDKNGLMFVGANELDYGVLEAAGLTPVQKEDRGRTATIYVDKDGTDVVKKLYAGFAIVLNGDMETAKSLARTAMKADAKE